LCRKLHWRVAARPRLKLTRQSKPAQGINDKRLRAYITLQAAHGMEYLHLNYMVHFDLKVRGVAASLPTQHVHKTRPPNTSPLNVPNVPNINVPTQLLPINNHATP
jgi:hypothetical protein